MIRIWSSVWRILQGTFKDTLHTETHFVPDPHMEHVVIDSVWRVIKENYGLAPESGSDIRITTKI